MSDPFAKKIQNFIFHRKIFKRGDGIVIGVSGGPDSVALARVLSSMQKKYDLVLSMLHVNYGMRGKDSDLDEKLVRDLSKELEVPLKVVKHKEANGGNIEQKLREFRYGEFDKERKKRKFQLVAVGHTIDDQVETVLMNMIRGAGIKGLSGMKAKQGNVIRPLLAVEKTEVVDYLKRIGQEHRIDRSNFDEKLLRNKVRHNLIPLLKKDYNPNIVSTVFKLADNLGKIERVVDEYTEKTYNDIAKREKDKVILDADRLDDISDELRSLVFRKVVATLKGDERNLENLHYFEFKKILESTKGKMQRLDILGLLFVKKGKLLEISKK